MIISCPYCRARYQVAYEAIGAAGRKVQCANCQKAWQAMPDAGPKPPNRPDLKLVGADPEDRLFEDMAEAGLDAAFEAEEREVVTKAEAFSDAMLTQAAAKAIEEMKAALPPRPDPAPQVVDDATLNRRRRAFSRRQHSLARSLPLARVRRALRVVGVALLVATFGLGIALRTEIVRLMPDMAGVYQAVGLGVNVVGLNFRDLRTVRLLRDGKDVMLVTAKIYSETGSMVPVPPVIVTLLDGSGRPLYEWSAAAPSPDLGPGEVVEFETQLAAPPAGMARVRLSFASGRTGGANLIGISGVPEGAGGPQAPQDAAPAGHEQGGGQAAAHPAPAQDHGAGAPATEGGH